MTALTQTGSDPLRQLLKERSASLFALYDSAQNKDLLDHLDRQGIACECLFSGMKKVTLKNVAPYLFSCHNFSDDAPKFINEIWQRGVSMLVETDGTLEQLKLQLKKNSFVKNSQGVECYFRYYDARAYSRFIRVATNEQLGQLFGTAIRCIYWIDTTSNALVGLHRRPPGILERLLGPTSAEFHLHTLLHFYIPVLSQSVRVLLQVRSGRSQAGFPQ